MSPPSNITATEIRRLHPEAFPPDFPPDAAARRESLCLGGTSLSL